MSESCKRWVALSDRVAIGEALARDEVTFARTHAASCSACRDEEAFWCDMASLVERRPMESGRAPKVRIEPVAIGPAATPAPPGSRRNVIASVALAALAIAAGFAIWRRPEAKPPTLATSAERERVREPEMDAVLTMTSGGSVEIDHHTAAVGEHLARGSVIETRDGVACLVLDLGVRACLAPGSVVRVTETGVARRLELVVGKVVAELETQAPGTSFGVTTRDGSAVAVGTAFSVEVPPDAAPVVTRVLHGTVVVRSTKGAEQRVRAHQMTSMTAAEPSPLPAIEEAAEHARIVTALPPPDATVVASHFDSDAPGALVTVDGRLLGATPLAVLLEPGDHAVTVDAPNRVAAVENVHVGAGVAPVSRRFRLDAAPVEKHPEPVAVTRARANANANASAADLLAAARERRARGDGDGAMTAYRELFSRYTKSPEAHAALVPFGEIELGRSDARSALDSFDAYLASGGSLEEEAHFGRIRALRMLGRTDDERVAIETLVARFPNGALSTSLRDRLRALTTKGAR